MDSGMESSAGHHHHHLMSSSEQQQFSNAGGWNGLTIKEILEKVDLFNVTVEDGDDDPIKGEKVLVGKTKTPAAPNCNRVVSSSYPESAFLGPKLWDKPIPLPPAVDDTEFSIMNIEDFLNENNISLDDISHTKNEYQESSSESQSSGSEGDDREQQQQQQQRSSKAAHGTRHNIIPKDVPNDFLYAESKRARAEREREEKRRKLDVEMEFAPEDLALATIPGANFDPRKRVFSTEELKPQPIIRKRKKHYVPSESKDDRYWEKRVKNNVAARRSREARRLKENQIALRAAFLERENNLLKLQMEEVRADNQRLTAEKRSLQEKLNKYQEQM